MRSLPQRDRRPHLPRLPNPSRDRMLHCLNRKLTMPRLRLAALLLLAGLVGLPTAASAASGRISVETNSGRRTATVVEFSRLKKGRRATVIVLHGGQGTGGRIRRTLGLDDQALASGRVMVYPDGVVRARIRRAQAVPMAVDTVRVDHDPPGGERLIVEAERAADAAARALTAVQHDDGGAAPLLEAAELDDGRGPPAAVRLDRDAPRGGAGGRREADEAGHQEERGETKTWHRKLPVKAMQHAVSAGIRQPGQVRPPVTLRQRAHPCAYSPICREATEDDAPHRPRAMPPHGVDRDFGPRLPAGIRRHPSKWPETPPRRARAPPPGRASVRSRTPGSRARRPRRRARWGRPCG